MEPLDVRHIGERPAESGEPAQPGGRAGQLAFVAHEARNPLATALWTSELLARMSPQDRAGPRGDKLSAMCLRSVLRVRQIVEDHFLSERLDAGGFAVRLEPVVLADVIGGILERRPADAAPVTTSVDPSVAVNADRALLERAIESLTAVAGVEQTPVSLAAASTGGGVELSIAGRPADAGALVDPVKGAPTDPTGRALSVPLARRIAAALNGSLAVRDGSWLLVLPAAAPAARPGSPPAP
jgi:hypothetical protein